MNSKGFSLLEAVIGFFLMVLIMLGSLRLFDAGLYYSSQAQQNTIAVRIAQKTLSEIRMWSGTPVAGGLEWDDWSDWDGYAQNDADESGYRVQVKVSDLVLKSPSTEMEESYPADQQKVMPDSFKTVDITVSWKDGRQQYTLTSVVGEPSRPLPATVRVAPVAGSAPVLNRDDTADFKAEAVDADGNVIKDVFFNWMVTPGEANGGLSGPRHGATATFVHAVLLPNLPTLYTQGQARVQASTVYHGRPAKGDSASFTLNP